MTLGPKALAVIAEGPQLVDGAFVKLADGRMLQSREPEPLEAFARRVALVAHAEGFADGARAQREMEPSGEMIQAGLKQSAGNASVGLNDPFSVFRAMQRVAPLVGVEG